MTPQAWRHDTLVPGDKIGGVTKFPRMTLVQFASFGIRVLRRTIDNGGST